MNFKLNLTTFSKVIKTKLTFALIQIPYLCNKQNNYVGNLEWCTNSENQKHAYRIGLNKSKPGEQNPSAKLTEQEVIEIADMIMAGVTHKEIAERFGISTITVSAIRSKRHWEYILKDYNFPKSKYSNIK